MADTDEPRKWSQIEVGIDYRMVADDLLVDGYYRTLMTHIKMEGGRLFLCMDISPETNFVEKKE